MNELASTANEFPVEPISRTQEEIVSRIKTVQNDYLGWEKQEYFLCLDGKHITEFMLDATVPTDYRFTVPTETWFVQVIRDNLRRAFVQAKNEMSLGVSRSISALLAWSWLAGKKHETLTSTIDQMRYNNFSPYGLPILRYVVQYFGWDLKDFED